MPRLKQTYQPLTVLTLLYILSVSTAFAQDDFFQFENGEIEQITEESLNTDDRIIYISDRWKFNPGDNPEWANPGFDDSDWTYASTNLSSADLSFIDWEGVGWFRKKLDVAEEASGLAFALIVDRHLGASEIYLNGKKIFELGTFTPNPENIESYSGNERPVVFFNEGVNTLAVRYASPLRVEAEQFFGYTGFRFLLGDWETRDSQWFAYITNWTSVSMFYTGILLTFWLIHFLLFVFYPKEKRNLYFSLFTGGLVVITYMLYKMEMARFTADSLFFMRFAFFLEIMVLAFAVRFMHTIDRSQNVWFSNAVLLCGFATGAAVWFFPSELIWLREIIIIVFIIELIRLLVRIFRQRKKGVWIIGVGMIVFVFGLMMSVLINFEIISGNVMLINVIGSGLLILSMSVFLSKEFASTQYNLEEKLKEVRTLSDKTIEQERINKEIEIEARLLEAENDRKTKELEEARTLQLSMLPKKLPSLDHYDIAVYMDTATEVGGDYYDYSVLDNEALLLALGDATGHGMKAGIMVAAAKSYFHSLAKEENCIAMLKRMSQGLFSMNMKMMYMGITLAKCREGNVEIATAGMPPVLHYKFREDTTDRITLKGLPLGSGVDYPYSGRNIELEKNDFLLFMSDGLTELFNSKRDMLGIEKIEQVLKGTGDMKAADVINLLSRIVENWSGGKEPEDDITFLVLKYVA
jgi:serine phosphatase RsbU (regulator of sigma subunit)